VSRATRRRRRDTQPGKSRGSGRGARAGSVVVGSDGRLRGEFSPARSPLHGRVEAQEKGSAQGACQTQHEELQPPGRWRPSPLLSSRAASSVLRSLAGARERLRKSRSAQECQSSRRPRGSSSLSSLHRWSLPRRGGIMVARPCLTVNDHRGQLWQWHS
jgi:hypothetical protein